MFQFPSNGKGFPNNYTNKSENRATGVSIPFKREGLSELALFVSLAVVGCGVSIPFKREGLSEQRIGIGHFLS